MHKMMRTIIGNKNPKVARRSQNSNEVAEIWKVTLQIHRSTGPLSRVEERGSTTNVVCGFFKPQAVTLRTKNTPARNSACPKRKEPLIITDETQIVLPIPT